MVNYIKTRLLSVKLIICFVMLLVYVQFLFGNAVIGQNMLDAKEAYVLMVNSKSSMVLYIMCMVIAMMYPSKNNAMYILRFGKRRWVRSELYSLILMIVIFQMMVALACFVWFPRLEADTWSPVFLAASLINADYYDMNIAMVYRFMGWILFSKPMTVFVVSFVLHVLLGIVIAVICLYCNLYLRAGYGLFAGFALFGLSDVIIVLNHVFGQSGRVNKIVSLFLLYDHAYIGNLSNGSAGGTLSVTSCMIIYLGFIVLLSVCVIDKSGKIEVT